MEPKSRSNRIVLVFCLLTTVVACSQVTKESHWPALIADVEHGQLFGAAIGDHWLSPDSAVIQMHDANLFSLYPPTGLRRRCVIRFKSQQEGCSQPALEFEDCAPLGKHVLAISAPWEAAPRIAQDLDPSVSTYSTLLSIWLREQGIDDSKPAIDQLLRVDLEADGRDEILFSATRYRGGVRSAAAGDYSVILLRKIVGNSARIIPVQQDLYPEACEAECEPQTSRIVAVLDVNGDGILEIVTEFKYFEGIKRVIYTIDELEVKTRLFWVCGV